MVYRIHKNYGIINGNAHQHNDADIGHHIQAHSQDEKYQHRAHAGQRQGQQNGKGMNQRFELGRHNHIN